MCTGDKLSSLIRVSGFIAVSLFLIGIVGPAKAVTCGSGATCIQNPSYLDITATTPSGVAVIDSWDITKATNGPTNHFFSSMNFSDVLTGLGQLNNTPLSDTNFASLSGGTDINLGGISGPTGSTVLGGTYSLSDSSLGAAIWGVHWDNHFLALVFAQAISSFTITGLEQGVSGVFAFNLQTITHQQETPLPGALLLFGSVLSGGYLFSKCRRKRRESKLEAIAA